MALQNKLKAFVRFDGSGRVIPSSLILQKSKPKVGDWKEINATQCCNGSSSTTTTTTTNNVTSSSWFGQITNPMSQPSEWDVCNGYGISIIVYTATTITSPFAPGTALYSDAGLTTLIPYESGAISINGRVYEIVNGYTNPLGSDGQSCSSITTTTTTTQTVYNFIGAFDNNAGGACDGGLGTQTFYTTGPLNAIYPQNGITIYFDANLTQPVTYAYIASPGIGVVFNCTNGLLSNQQSCF